MIPEPASSGESRRHRELKRAAHAWALAQGYRFSAMEVSLPRCAFRADVAACRRAEGDHPGRCAIFECKQSRPDFLNDSADVATSLARLRELNARRTRLEARLAVHHPHLALGDSLFPEFERHDFDHLRHDGYRRLRREIRVLERRLFGRSKLDRLLRYAIADACYLVVFPGILDPHEVPSGWGILVARHPSTTPPDPPPPSRATDRDPPLALHLARRPARIDCPPRTRLEFLERIAAVATRETNRRASVEWEDVGPPSHRPRRETQDGGRSPSRRRDAAGE